MSLAVVRLDGSSVGVEWDTSTFEYLVDVSWTSYGDPLLVVSTRDQTRFVVLAVDVASGATRAVAEITDEQWVDASPGAFRWAPDGRLLTLQPDRASDTYRLHLGDDWLTPAGVQVRGVADIDADGVLVATAPDPAFVVAREGRLGLSGLPSCHSSKARSGVRRYDLIQTIPSTTVWMGG